MQPGVKAHADQLPIAGRQAVFADDQQKVNACLARQIAETVQEQELTQFEAAAVLAIDQPKVSRLLRGQLHEFSTARLLRFLSLLGRDVEIVVHPAASVPRRMGRLRIASYRET